MFERALSSPPFFWLVLAIILMLAHWLFRHKGGQLHWPALSALMMALIVLVFPLDWRWQLALFSLMSLFSWLVGRQIYAPVKLRIASYPARRYPVGKVLPLLDTPSEGFGRIRVGNTLWRVRLRNFSQPVSKGALVKVVARSRRILVVEPVEATD